MEKIENKYLTIGINEKGGALASIFDKANNKNLMYTPNSRSWSGTDVVIFPVVARLKNGIYHHNGEEYALKNHGILRYVELTPVRYNEQKLGMKFVSNDESKKIYPFDFEFEVIYELKDKQLAISYNVLNTGNETMYFSLGGHPAIKVDVVDLENCQEFDNTFISFNKEIHTNQYVLDNDGSFITHTKEVVLSKRKEFKKNDITDSKTLIYDARDINKTILETKNYRFIFNTKECEILAIWTWPNYGNYICIEPWWGIPDYENPNLEIKDKPFVHALNPNAKFNSGYSIKIENK